MLNGSMTNASNTNQNDEEITAGCESCLESGCMQAGHFACVVTDAALLSFQQGNAPSYEGDGWVIPAPKVVGVIPRTMRHVGTLLLAYDILILSDADSVCHATTLAPAGYQERFEELVEHQLLDGGPEGFQITKAGVSMVARVFEATQFEGSALLGDQ